MDILYIQQTYKMNFSVSDFGKYGIMFWMPVSLSESPSPAEQSELSIVSLFR